MKFGHLFEFHKIPDWYTEYVQYRQLKLRIDDFKALKNTGLVKQLKGFYMINKKGQIYPLDFSEGSNPKTKKRRKITPSNPLLSPEQPIFEHYTDTHCPKQSTSSYAQSLNTSEIVTEEDCFQNKEQCNTNIVPSLSNDAIVNLQAKKRQTVEHVINKKNNFGLHETSKDTSATG